MKNIKIVFAALVVAGGSLIYSSCQKSEMNLNPQQSGTSSLRAATDEAYMNNELTYVDNLVEAIVPDPSKVGFGNDGTVRGFGGLPPCASVTYDTSGALKTATINFGETPCLTGGEREYKQGVLIITWTGPRIDSGTVITIATQNYMVGDTTTEMHPLSFSKTITNMGADVAGHIHFAIVVSNATLTLDSGQVVTWSANRDREWIQVPANQALDYFLITGASSGTDRNGEPFTSQITTPLRKNADCEWIVSGVEVVTHGNNPSRTIDYGNGECDNIATVTVNGNTFTIHFDVQ